MDRRGIEAECRVKLYSVELFQSMANRAILIDDVLVQIDHFWFDMNIAQASAEYALTYESQSRARLSDCTKDDHICLNLLFHATRAIEID